MVKSMFAAIAGLKTHQSKMDVISNNIANVNTWGFKNRSANFSDAMYQNRIQGGGGYDVDGYSGGMNTSQLGFGVNMSSISADFTTGSWNPTGNGLHCMINGPSFFIVGPFHSTEVTDVKTGGVSLSRVGIFSVDNNGYLVDDQGNYVYGYACTNVGASTEADGTPIPAKFEGEPDMTANPPTVGRMTPIRIPSGEEVRGANDTGEIQNGFVDLTSTADRAVFQSYTIGTDGTIVAISDDGKPFTLGKIAVASVQNVNGLEQQQGYLYGVGGNAGLVTHMAAGAEAVGTILSGYLEMSNVDLANEIASMITTQRGYQANTKMITVTDEMLAELVNMKR